MIDNLGFTGTREGMTNIQYGIVGAFVAVLKPERSHSGDCEGSDEQFIWIVRDTSREMYFECETVGHIPDDDSHRAFEDYDIELKPLPYLVRNKMIVRESDWLLATPKEQGEQIRSGTWATIREARRQGKRTTIIYPNGLVEGDGIPNDF